MTQQDDNATRSFYDRISKSYDAIADANEHVAREKGLTALAVAEGETVLEVGFGTGHSLAALAEAVGEEGRVLGIDISPGMLEVSQKHLEKAGLSSRVELRVGDGRDLPYEDDRCDVVTMSFTLELFPLEEIPQVLAEIRRVLRPGGRLGVVAMATTPDGQHESLLTHVYKWMHRHFPHWVDCQPIDAEKYITDAGFEITSQESLKIWTLPVAVLVAKSPA